MDQVTLNTDETKKIKKHYVNEYYKKAINDRPGLLGKFTRWMNKPRGPLTLFGGLMVAIVASAALPHIAGAIAFYAIVSVVGTATLAGINALYGRGINRATNKAMDAAIADGTLLESYNEKVLKPQIEALPATEAALKAESALVGAAAEEAKKNFNSAAKDKQPQAASSARKRLLARLHRHGNAPA